MRAKEFITEQKMSEVHDLLDVAKLSLPYSYRLNKLMNSDFYQIYRFGVALADVKGEKADENPLNKGINPYKPEFRAQSAWGENVVVSGFDPSLGQTVAKAAAKVSKAGQTEVSTPGSDEMGDTNKNSVLKPFKGYGK
jgi:hypothetical protein